MVFAQEIYDKHHKDDIAGIVDGQSTPSAHALPAHQHSPSNYAKLKLNMPLVPEVKRDTPKPKLAKPHRPSFAPHP